MKVTTQFAGKRILLMGLGVLGRGVNVAKFLAEEGALLTITDLKTEKDLAPSLRQLKKFSNIKYVLGEHRLSDFSDKDMVIRAANVPLGSPYLAEAKKNGIPIEMDASLFSKLVPTGVTLVGITGTRGKTTITQMIYETLIANKKRAFLGGNVRGLATLPLLKKVKAGDIVVMELDSWQLQGFGEQKISPHVAVFSNLFPDHLNYYKGDIKRYYADKANVYKFQKMGDVLIAGKNLIKTYHPKTKAKIAQYSASSLSKVWALKIPGLHNRENAAGALLALRVLGIPEEVIKSTLENFGGVPGRLQYLRAVRGVEFWNDSCSTMEVATLVALGALKDKKIVFIGGGADKNLKYDVMARKLATTVNHAILFRGAATDKIIEVFRQKKFSRYEVVESMRAAVKSAVAVAKRGDTILLSPGALSHGVFKNEYDRSDQFVKEVSRLKS